MLLGKIEIVFAEGFGLQAGVDITFKRQNRLAGILRREEEVSVSLASLIKSPLNVRTVPYSAESVSELAESIKGVGLLQNLVDRAGCGPAQLRGFHDRFLSR